MRKHFLQYINHSATNKLFKKFSNHEEAQLEGEGGGLPCPFWNIEK